MNRPFSKIWKETLIIALCFILLGCFMLMQPDKTLAFFSYVIGAFILVLAVFAFYRHYRLQRMLTFELFYGIICSVGALLIFLNQSIVETLIPIVLGIVMIANSVFKLRYIFQLQQNQVPHWYVSLILSFIKIALGILIMTNPLEAMITLTQFIGVIVLLFAGCDLADLIFIKIYLKQSIDEEYKNKDNHKQIKDVEYTQIEDDK